MGSVINLKDMNKVGDLENAVACLGLLLTKFVPPQLRWNTFESWRTKDWGGDKDFLFCEKGLPTQYVAWMDRMNDPEFFSAVRGQLITAGVISVG